MILFLYPTSSYGEAYIYDVHVCLLLSSHIGARIYISWLGRKICTSIQLGCGSEIAFSSDSILLFRKEILTEAPENDRFHWRKYGEKKILKAEYPRYVSLVEFHGASSTLIQLDYHWLDYDECPSVFSCQSILRRIYCLCVKKYCFIENNCYMVLLAFSKKYA